MVAWGLFEGLAVGLGGGQQFALGVVLAGVFDGAGDGESGHGLV